LLDQTYYVILSYAPTYQSADIYELL
jgi:hypothetical protein